MLALFLLSLPCLTQSVLIAVDLGSESMRVSMLQRGRPVSIVLTGDGRRFTPAVAAILPVSADAPPIFTNEDVAFFQRSVGDLSIVQRYPLNSTRFLPQLLGKNYSSKLVSYFLRRNLTMPFDANEEDALELVAPPEFFAAQLLMSGVADARRVRVNLTVDGLALVIPKYLTHHQRCAFVRSARLATFSPMLIETMDAIGHLFAVEKSQLFRNQTLMVCFIDIGASQMQVSIQEFKYGATGGIQIQEIGYAWTDRVGSYSVDAALGRVIRREVLKQKPDAVFDDRAVQRIIAAARKVKHELTLQPEVTLYLEDLVRGFDMSFTYSIDRLKRLCRRELAVLNATFFEALHGALLEEPEDIDRFELVGGGTRSPLFQDAINGFFNGKVPVMRSLNTEEASVLGAGYHVAASRKGFLAHEMKFTTLDIYNITVSTGRYTTFSYAQGTKLPLGIGAFIRTVDLRQTGQYHLVDGRVRVRGAKKLTRSGLHKERRVQVEQTLHAFETMEKAAAEKAKVLHEFESTLLEARDKVTKDPIVLEIASSEERMEALRVIANVQYQVGKDRNIDDEELERLKADVERATSRLLKRAQEKKDTPMAYEKLKDFLHKVTVAVETDWPRVGMRPKSKPFKVLGRMCAKTDRWLKEHTDLNEVSIHDINLMFEKLRSAFENVKKTLKKAKSSAEL